MAFFLLGCGLAGVGLAFVAFTMGAGVVLAITIFGLAILALSLRSARGIGGLQREPGPGLLRERWRTPSPSLGRPGFFGWLGSRLRDRVAWRSVAYLALKVPWSILGVFVAFSLWWDAFVLLTLPLFGHGGAGRRFGDSCGPLPPRTSPRTAEGSRGTSAASSWASSSSSRRPGSCGAS